MTTLSPRQQQVVSMIGEGKPYKAIAHELSITIASVKFHAKRAAEKLPKPYLARRARIIDWWNTRA